jgi:myosin heavy subunit
LLLGHGTLSVATRREAVDDLVLMSKVDEESIVTTLKVRSSVAVRVFLIPSSQKRFLELQNIYTYIGPVLVSVNPYQKIPNTGA